MNDKTDTACASVSKSMRQPTTMELLEEKLKNFKDRFAQDMFDMGFTRQQIDDFGAIELISEFIALKMYWGMIEAWNLDFFLALAAARPPPAGLTDAQIHDWCKSQQLVIRHINTMSAASIRLGWQYANFFLKCVRELTAAKK